MTEFFSIDPAAGILLLKLAHLLLFVYWLGGDLGVFYSSNYVVRSGLSVEARQTAARIMFWLDQGPRMCMTMILPTGIQLASAMGYLAWSNGALALTWLVCLAWLVNVNVIHLTGNPHTKKRLEQIDFGFRIALITALACLSVFALVTDGIIPTDRVALKLFCFALLVACGLMIRVFLRPFGPAFAALLQHGETPEGDRIMQASLSRCRYFVVLIWALLLFNAALGLHLLDIAAG